MKQNDLYSLIKKNKQDRHVISFFTSPLLAVVLTTIITSHSQADTSQPASSVVQPIENLDKLNIDLLQSNSQLDQQQKQIIEDKNNQKQQKPVNVTDEDVKNNPHIAEIIINTSIEKRGWKTLEKVLPLYQQSPQHDPMLVLYGQGALLRHQGKITQAIQSYQKMLDNDPTLDYVRFDIAIMLFENRQYRQAEQMFKQTVNNSEMEQNIRTLSAQFLTQIKKQEQVKGKAHLRFLHNDNVNQATNDRHLQIGDWILTKNDANMPRSSMGTNYALNLNQDSNISNNNFLNWELKLNGVNYASAHEFDEHSFNLGVNYKWQNMKSWFTVGPTMNWSWMGQKPYVDSYGLSFNYFSLLSLRWATSLNAGWSNKSYQRDGMDSFDGNSFYLSPNFIYLSRKGDMLYMGLVMQQENLNLKSESFELYGVNFGHVREWKNGLNTTVFSQFSSRKYDANNPTFGIPREDIRFNAMINVGHKKLNFKKIEPKLSFQYDNIDSNIDQFYTRQNRQWMLTFEHKF